jgi:hypothetical protein
MCGHFKEGVDTGPIGSGGRRHRRRADLGQRHLDSLRPAEFKECGTRHVTKTATASSYLSSSDDNQFWEARTL